MEKPNTQEPWAERFENEFSIRMISWLTPLEAHARLRNFVREIRAEVREEDAKLCESLNEKAPDRCACTLGRKCAWHESHGNYYPAFKLAAAEIRSKI